MTDKSTPMDPQLAAYLLAHQPAEHPELSALRVRTAEHPEAMMQISVEQGHFLALLVKLMGARRVLEIGTFTGYSTLAMALALPVDGQLVACDVDPLAPAVGKPYWQRAGVASKIDLRIAPAMDTLRALLDSGFQDRFDLSFIDADKPGYDAYYEAALRLVRPGGLIVFDNMLQRGRVARLTELRPDTIAIRALNAKLAKDVRIDAVLLPIATGMTLARKR